MSKKIHIVLINKTYLSAVQIKITIESKYLFDNLFQLYKGCASFVKTNCILFLKPVYFSLIVKQVVP